MNREQRRAAGLKGKRLKRIREKGFFVVSGGRSNGKAVGEAVYRILKGEESHV